MLNAGLYWYFVDVPWSYLSDIVGKIQQSKLIKVLNLFDSGEFENVLFWLYVFELTPKIYHVKIVFV